MQKELGSPPFEHLPGPKATITSMCLRCQLEALLLAKHIDLSTECDREKLSNQWGDHHLQWLGRLLDGEITWIPFTPFINLLGLLEIQPDSRQEKILIELNKRNFFQRGRWPTGCPKHFIQ